MLITKRQHMKLEKTSTNFDARQKRKDGITSIVCASLVVANVISYISLMAFQ